MKMRSTLVTAALLCLAVGDGLAQQKHQVSFKIPTENSKYIVSLRIPGDVAHRNDLMSPTIPERNRPP
jgi:hypothetical protein